jgi:iron complex outermembrane receptor protein
MNTIKRIITASAALIISLQVASAQFTLKGMVKDNETNQPIPGATVSVPNSTTATSTDAQGMFTLQSPTNFDSVKIASVGYATQTIAAGDKSQSINVMLKVSSNALNEVQVLGIKKAQTVNVLTADDLNRGSGLNLQDALNDVPGVDMMTRTPWGGERITIRGYMPNVGMSQDFNGLGYKLYIDNVPVTDATGATIMDDIDFSMLGKVEVYKGPTPLYGSYIAGAVNLFTPVPNQTSVQEQVIGGSYGLFRTNTTINIAGDNSGIFINYGHQTYNGDYRANNNSLKNFVTFAGDFKAGNNNVISTYFSYNNSVEHLGGEIDSAAFYGHGNLSNAYYDDNNSQVDIESFRTGVTDKYTINKHFGEQTTLFATASELQQPFAHGFDLDNTNTFGGRSAFTFENKGDKLTINGILGASFEKTNQIAEGDFVLPFIAEPPFYTTTPAIPSDANNYAMNYAIFTNWDFKLPSNITLTVGGSLNFNEFGTQNLLDASGVYLNNPTKTQVFSPVFTPNVSLIKVFNDNVSAYVSFSQGYAPPLLSELTNTAGKVDSTLKPESANQFEIGTKGSLCDHKLSYQLALYDLDITNRLVQETVNSITSYTNAGEQRNMGAELFLSYAAISNKDAAVTLLRPWISYTYSDDKYITFVTYNADKKTGGDTVGATYSGNKAVGVAPNVFNLGIDVATKMGFYLNVKFQYVDKVPITYNNSNSAEAYQLLGGRLGYKKQFGTHLNIDAFVGADNLLNSTYYTFLFYGPNINGLAQTSDHGSGDGYILPAPYKATFYGGLTFKYTF